MTDCILSILCPSTLIAVGIRPDRADYSVRSLLFNPILITMDKKIVLVNFNGCIIPVESREELAELREQLNDVNS